jgi:hypothetical protein
MNGFFLALRSHQCSQKVSGTIMNQLVSLFRIALSIYLVRLVLFGIVSFATYVSIYLAAVQSSASALSTENGPLELLQVGFVGSASLMLLIAAVRSESGRACLTVMGAMAGYATAREMDSVFESLLFDDAYKYLVGLPLLAVVSWTVWQDRSHLMSDWVSLAKQPVVTLFAIGGIYLFCVCQILDSTAFWAETPGIIPAPTSLTHPAKQMVEEFCEVFAYLLIGFSGVESIVMTLPGRKEEVETGSDTESYRPTISIASWQEERRRAA